MQIRGGGRGTKRILYINRKAPFRGPTSNPFYRSLNSTISGIKGTPQFPEYVKKWYPFHIPSVE